DPRQAAHPRPRPGPDHGGRLRHQLRQGRPDPLLLDPGHEGRGSGGARLHLGRGGEGAGTPRVDPLEAPPPDGGGDVADGDRRVLPAAGRLLMHAKHPRESETVMSELMMPQHANIMGNVFGGVVLALVDRVAAVAAIRHAGKPCVTVSVDKVDFREPIHVGELLTAYTRVNFAGRTSMEVGVKIIAENVLTGEKRHTNSCYVTYVALDATSMGAVIGAALASGATYDEVVIAARSLSRRDVAPIDPLALVKGVFAANLFKPDGLRRAIERLVPATRFEALQTPFTLTAT